MSHISARSAAFSQALTGTQLQFSFATATMRRHVVALLRHGHFDRPKDTPSAHLLLPLSATGREQAREAAPHLLTVAQSMGLDIDPIIECSPLLRARQFADELASVLENILPQPIGEISVCEQPALAERSLGAAANLSRTQIAELMKIDSRHQPLPDGWEQDRGFRLPVLGAESMTQAGARVVAHLEGIAQRGHTEHRLTVLVGHIGAFQHALVDLGLLNASNVDKLAIGYGKPVLIEKTASVGWQHIAGEWELRRSGSNSNDESP